MIRNFLARSFRFGGSALFCGHVVLLLAAQAGKAQTYAPLLDCAWGPKGCTVPNNKPAVIAPEGFGDRQNSWAWSMAWYNGKLLVGTARSEQCITDLSEHLILPSEPYPPRIPIFCARRSYPTWPEPTVGGGRNLVFQSHHRHLDDGFSIAAHHSCAQYKSHFDGPSRYRFSRHVHLRGIRRHRGALRGRLLVGGDPSGSAGRASACAASME